MSDKWTEATKRYERDAEEQPSPEIKKGVALLEAFLSSDEGGQALGLLRASEETIIFGEMEGGLGRIGILINEDGLQKSCVTLNDAKERELSSCESMYVVLVFAEAFKDKKPTDIVDWLCAELDSIADKAPFVQEG